MGEKRTGTVAKQPFEATPNAIAFVVPISNTSR